MFQESPFSGVCAYSSLEVITMLVGTLLLGLLLGYLIWGWTRRQLKESEARNAKLNTSIANLKEELARITSASNEQLEDLNKLKIESEDLKRNIDVFSTKNAELKQQQNELISIGEETRSELAKLGSAIAANESLISKLYAELSQDQPDEGEVSSVTDTATRLGKVRQGPDPELLNRASEIFGKEITFDDLTVVEGIGPKIAAILNESGINSWNKLSDTTRYILRVVLDEAGPQFGVHNPKTWPRQARMAASGEWKKLKAYQDMLKGGK